jgi:hypothetical protein
MATGTVFSGTAEDCAKELDIETSNNNTIASKCVLNLTNRMGEFNLLSSVFGGRSCGARDGIKSDAGYSYKPSALEAMVLNVG